ncbi:hypothetical protein [Denitrobaculum tricleocarpae]|uniref:Sulfotransferase family protein n=1 Tax=Denitrobaculum tricleocarpae TaxID=2591009 RepID=A0A545U2D8_9PROT|nr:hypothetical protein [Denitrobaculum tricleocarpae]TQV83645.1 hypothetical protein FKG95_03385 [Denitrobaculum tricleocarpae]
MLIVHIGLGKTATTTLQRSVFPKLKDIVADLSYNKPEVMYLCRKHHLYGLSADENSRLRALLSEAETTLISDESLVNWNPRLWEKAANRNLELFGPDARIVITIRKPLEYLTSVYQQMVHQGNVKDAAEFFVASQTYDRLEPVTQGMRLEYFDVDAFSLERLHEVYKSRFRHVTVVPLSKISEFSFLAEPLHLSGGSVSELRRQFETAPRVNVAYSSLAMKLTFARERIFGVFGAKTAGSNDRAGYFWCRHYFGDEKPGQKKTAVLYRDLPFSQKLAQFPARVFGRMGWRRFDLTWRSFMQKVVNNYLPYRKYALPADVPIPEAVLRANENYFKTCESGSERAETASRTAQPVAAAD